MALPMKELTEQSYEQGLPEYLQHDLDAYKDGLRTHSPILDWRWYPARANGSRKPVYVQCSPWVFRRL